MKKYLKRAFSKLKEVSLDSLDYQHYKIKCLGKYFRDSFGKNDYTPEKLVYNESAMSSGKLIEKGVEKSILNAGLVLLVSGGLLITNYFVERPNALIITDGELCKTVGLLGGILTSVIGGVWTYVGVKDRRKYNKELKELEEKIGTKELKRLKEEIPKMKLDAYAEGLRKDVFSDMVVEVENLGGSAYDMEAWINGFTSRTRNKKIAKEIETGRKIKSELRVNPKFTGKRRGILSVRYRDALNRKHKDSYVFYVDIISDGKIESGKGI